MKLMFQRVQRTGRRRRPAPPPCSSRTPWSREDSSPHLQDVEDGGGTKPANRRVHVRVQTRTSAEFEYFQHKSALLVLLTRLLGSFQFTWNPSKAWLLLFLTNCLITVSSTCWRKFFNPSGSTSSWFNKHCSDIWFCGSVWEPVAVVDRAWSSTSAVWTAPVWQAF